MKSSMICFLLLVVATFGQATTPASLRFNASFAIRHLSYDMYFEWEDRQEGYLLATCNGAYRLRTITRRQSARGKIIYRFECGTYKIHGSELLCKSNEVFTSTTPEQKPERVKSILSAVQFSKFEDEIQIPKEIGVRRIFSISRQLAEPTIRIDRARLKYISP